MVYDRPQREFSKHNIWKILNRVDSPFGTEGMTCWNDTYVDVVSGTFFLGDNKNNEKENKNQMIKKLLKLMDGAQGWTVVVNGELWVYETINEHPCEWFTAIWSEQGRPRAVFFVTVMTSEMGSDSRGSDHDEPCYGG